MKKKIILKLLFLISFSLLFFSCSSTEKKPDPKKPEPPKSEVKEVEEKKVVDLSDKIIKDTSGMSKINVKNVLFDFDSTKIFANSESIDEVIALMEKLSQYESIEYKINIVGHTDSMGSKKYNQKLSERRAKAVHNLLKEKEFKNVKVYSSGRGEEDVVKMVINKQLTRKERIALNQQNRRVEFFFILLDSGKVEIKFEKDRTTDSLNPINPAQ